MKKIRNLIMYSVVFCAGYTASLVSGFSNFSDTFSSTKDQKIKDQQKDTAIYQKELSLDKKIAELDKKIKELEMKKSFATKKVIGDKKVLASSLANNELAPSVVQASAAIEDIAALRDYKTQNEINKHEQHLKALGATPHNLAVVLNENFSKESMDNSWAPKKKELLDKFISANALLAALPNISSECKSTQCKLTFIGDSQTNINDLNDSLSGIVSGDDQHFDAYTTVVDDKNHVTSIYFNRNPSEGKTIQ